MNILILEQLIDHIAASDTSVNDEQNTLDSSDLGKT